MKLLSIFIILVSTGALFSVVGAIGLGDGLRFEFSYENIVMLIVTAVSLFLISVFTKELASEDK